METDGEGDTDDDDGADDDVRRLEEELLVDDFFVFFLLPPPTGMFLRAPPLVQYLLQFLQKWRGCERL